MSNYTEYFKNIENADINLIKKMAYSTLNNNYVKYKKSKSYPDIPISVGSIRNVANLVIYLCQRIEKLEAK